MQKGQKFLHWVVFCIFIVVLGFIIPGCPSLDNTLAGGLQKVLGGCNQCNPDGGEGEDDTDTPPVRTTANVLVTAIETHWGWKQGWKFKLEAVDGTYIKTVAITSETATRFQNLFTDVPLNKSLIFYTPTNVQSYTYYAFQLPDNGTKKFEVTGTGIRRSCGLGSCIDWSWLGP